MKRRALIASICTVLVVGCDSLKARRLRGQWESEALPKRTLVLRDNGSFARRLSGKTLGFLSEIVGPEQGVWRVEGDQLVLTTSHESKETTERLPIKDLSGDSVWLGGERWLRLP